MGPTRPVTVYQDSTAATSPPMSFHNMQTFHYLGYPDGNTQPNRPTDHSLIFNWPPPAAIPSGRSPLKAIRQASSSPPKGNVVPDTQNTSFPPPSRSTFKTGSPSKKHQASTFLPIAPHKPLNPIFASFPCNNVNDKENTAPHSDNIAEFPEPSQSYRGSLKRSLSGTIMSSDISSKKIRNCEKLPQGLPDPASFPALEDDGSKPQYSYAMLIGMAILRSPDRKLTLAQIYKWISDSFSHYRKEDSGWQNSIRHNLSLNKSFIKQERPKDDPGKGNYWAIKPGAEGHFIKDKGTRRPASSGAVHKSTSSMASSEANSLPHLSSSTLAPAHADVRGEDPSSEATLPASDATSVPEDDLNQMPPPSAQVPESPLLEDFRSSPPLLPQPRNDTPSPIPGTTLPVFNGLESKRQKLPELDDSGYFSSLDSSAVRPYANPALPRYDIDRSHIKRGRAEEEIARIRSSSHEISPSKLHSLVNHPTPSLVSSSPIRNLDTHLMLPPLTPAARFKIPAKPPPSVSPNTNLRNHRNKVRELIGSPAKFSMHTPHDLAAYSPAFKIAEDDSLFGEQYEAACTVFDDDHAEAHRRPASASPIKAMSRRPDRTYKSANVLADITAEANIVQCVSTTTRNGPTVSPLAQKSTRSPLRSCTSINEGLKETLLGLDFFNAEESDTFDGLDILQGFSKIGSQKSSAYASHRLARPTIGARSHSAFQ